MSVIFGDTGVSTDRPPPQQGALDPTCVPQSHKWQLA